MAKPGTRDARRISRGRDAAQGVVDLGAVAMSDEMAAQVGAELELVNGMRCYGCGRRIAQGFRFTSIDPRAADKSIMELSACAREDCDFSGRAQQGATAVEMLEFVWLDTVGADAPAIERIAARYRQVQEAAQAAAEEAVANGEAPTVNDEPQADPTEADKGVIIEE